MKREVKDPSIMQYLELGYVRDDAMPERKAKDRKQVFNEQFVEAMMLHGWYPGAAWERADTMHFDFLEGYDAIKGDAKRFGPTD